MIFFTSMALGLAAGLSRSAFMIAFVAVLLALAFAAAMLVSAGPVGFSSLLVAIAGYNLGLFNLVLAALAIDRLRTA